jgi:hypothetical protein
MELSSSNYGGFENKFVVEKYTTTTHKLIIQDYFINQNSFSHRQNWGPLSPYLFISSSNPLLAHC